MPKTIKRVALVTGAKRGIGFEIARQLALKKMTVLMGARHEQKGLEAQNKLADQRQDVHFIRIDVTDPMSVEAAICRVKDEFRRLDVLVKNLTLKGVQKFSRRHLPFKPIFSGLLALSG